MRVRLSSRAGLRPIVRACVGAALLAATACGSSGDSLARSDTSTTAPAKKGTTLVFSGQGNDLGVYDAESPFTKQIAIHHNDAAHPAGLDINGQICFDPRNPNRFVAGEDTRRDTTGHPGWGILQITDTTVGQLKVKEVGKLVPTYQPSNDNPENYGCGFLDDGRIVTTDVGNQASGPGDGQFIVWFPPFESRTVKYCKVDVHLATGQGALVDSDSVYVSQGRPPRAGVYRYDVKDLPTSSTPSGGCDGKDATGAPLATHVMSTLFIAPSSKNTLATPAGIAKGPDGHFYIASVYNGVIAEFNADGTFVRDVLKPPAGEMLGEKPFSTGTPSGVGVAPDGSVYYADIGIVATADGIGPVTMDQGLASPDGIGIWEAPDS